MFFSGNDFPWTTFFVNLLGCFIIGVAWTLLKGQTMEAQRLLLITGILGGFTTFSSFSIETFQLIQSGQTSTAILYAIGSLVLGVFLSFLGYFFAETLE